MERRLNNILVMVIIGVVCFMSIGYSLLNRELSITGELTYRPNADIRITNLTQGTIKDATIQYADYTKNEINFAYKPTTTSATVALTVEVTNYTDTEMGILKIENLPTNATITGYTLKDKLKNATVPLKAGMSTTFTITFESTAVETKALTLNFDFEPFYKVTYEGFSSISGYKTEVLKGDNFSQNMGANTQICKVTMNGSAISSYTFENGVITISNVTGDIVIKGGIGGDAVETPITTPNPPELNGDMIPVRYQQGADATTGNWVKAEQTNKDNDWYDYTNQKWANAVTVKENGTNTRNYYKNEAPAGTVIPIKDINTMWVWIPRYSYTIRKDACSNLTVGKGTYGNDKPTRNLPGEIDVKFIPTSENDTTGSAQYTGSNPTNWRTNEAFDFPETDAEGNNTPTKRAGLWVGKFETTGTLEKNDQACENTNCNVSNVTIKPGESSLRSQKVSSFFYMARSMQMNNNNVYGFDKTKGDLHMMKNDEWGAVAYLSQSRYGKYGNSDYSGANKEVYINNNKSYITGSSGGGPNEKYSDTDFYEYNDMTELGKGKGQAGPGASTTGTIYGIYDMSGGAYEYVMGVLEYDTQGVETHNGQIVAGSSRFKGLDKKGSSTGTVDLPNEKYYNTYKSANPTSYIWSQAKLESACDGGVCYGHALSETSSWYYDYDLFVYRSAPWLKRGGNYSVTTGAGVFSASYYYGDSFSDASSRLVLL